MAPPKNATNPLTADLDAAGHDITNARDIRAAGGAVVEMNAQGDYEAHSGPGATAATVEADSGALVQLHGTGSGTPGDAVLSPGRGAYVRIQRLPTTDPAVVGALWNDAGTLKVSAG